MLESAKCIHPAIEACIVLGTDDAVDKLRVIHPTLRPLLDQSSDTTMFGIDWAMICPLCEMRAPTVRATSW